jgi:hypothetical protein
MCTLLYCNMFLERMFILARKSSAPKPARMVSRCISRMGAVPTAIFSLGRMGFDRFVEATLLEFSITDQIQSVRQSFIPEYKLRFSGKVFMRATFDAALVEGKIPSLPADSVHWVGIAVEKLKAIADSVLVGTEGQLFCISTW